MTNKTRVQIIDNIHHGWHISKLIETMKHLTWHDCDNPDYECATIEILVDSHHGIYQTKVLCDMFDITGLLDTDMFETDTIEMAIKPSDFEDEIIGLFNTGLNRLSTQLSYPVYLTWNENGDIALETHRPKI